MGGKAAPAPALSVIADEDSGRKGVVETLPHPVGLEIPAEQDHPGIEPVLQEVFVRSMGIVDHDPLPPSPQQCPALANVTPQVWAPPALTEAIGSSTTGPVDAPRTNPITPQHSMPRDTV